MWTRLVALASSFWQLEQSAEVDTLRNFSSHAQSLDALIATDFWSRHTIDEDGQQFWRSYFAFNSHHKVVPLFIPVYQDAVQNKTYFSTLKKPICANAKMGLGLYRYPICHFKNVERKSFSAVLEIFRSFISFS